MDKQSLIQSLSYELDMAGMDGESHAFICCDLLADTISAIKAAQDKELLLVEALSFILQMQTRGFVVIGETATLKATNALKAYNHETL